FVHLLFLVGQLVNALDRWFQRPLARVVPQWEQLLDEPARTLAEGEIVIGPKPRLLSNLLLAASWSFLIVLIARLIMMGPQRFWRLDRSIVGAWIAVAAVGFDIVSWWRRGGQVLLEANGATLRNGATDVVCPWLVFNITGDPFPIGNKGTLLPVAPRELHRI